MVTSAIFEPAWDRTLGAGSDSVRSLAVTGNAIWIAHAVGLDRLDLDTDGAVAGREHFGADQGLGGDHVVAIEPTTDGKSLWVSAGGGLTKIDASNGKVLHRVTRDEGLLDDEAWVSHSLRVGPDGKVYFGTPHGLTIYDPSRHQPPEPIATPQMRQVRVELGADGFNRVDLAWAAATYLAENAVRFSTRLVGIDDWSEPSARPEATYTHLPVGDAPRTYTFQVRTSPQPGVWLDEILEQEFVIKPSKTQPVL